MPAPPPPGRRRGIFTMYRYVHRANTYRYCTLCGQRYITYEERPALKRTHQMSLNKCLKGQSEPCAIISTCSRTCY
jgi:hypothetical protein